MNNSRDVVFTNCSFTGEVEVTTSVEVELPTRFYYDGLVGNLSYFSGGKLAGTSIKR